MSFYKKKEKEKSNSLEEAMKFIVKQKKFTMKELEDRFTDQIICDLKLMGYIQKSI